MSHHLRPGVSGLHTRALFLPPPRPRRFLDIPSLLISNGPRQDARMYIHVASCWIPIKLFVFSRVPETSGIVLKALGGSPHTTRCPSE